ncbi:MAG: hypothetical protein Q9165_004247 [Trypethelium subeluteriae]
MQPYGGLAIMASLAGRITAEQGPTLPPTEATPLSSDLKRQDLPESTDEIETSDVATEQYARRSDAPETTPEPSCTSFFSESSSEPVKRSALENSDTDQATESTTVSSSPQMPFRNLMARTTLWLNGTSLPTPAVTTSPTIGTDKANGSYSHIEIEADPQQTLVEELVASNASAEPNTRILLQSRPETTEVDIIEGETDDDGGFEGPFTVVHLAESPLVTAGAKLEGNDDGPFTLGLEVDEASTTAEATIRGSGNKPFVQVESGEDASADEAAFVEESDDGQLDVYITGHHVRTLEKPDHAKRTTSDDLQVETMTESQRTDSPLSTSTVSSTLSESVTPSTFSEYTFPITPDQNDPDSPQGAEGAGAVLSLQAHGTDLPAMLAKSGNHTINPMRSPCSTSTLPELAVTTHYACEHSTRDIIPIFAHEISRLAYPELPFIPGIRERYNYFQDSDDRCALCRLPPSHSPLGSDHDVAKVHHYICGHQSTTLVPKPHATEWPRGSREEALRNPAGTACGACVRSYSKILFDCGHHFLLPKIISRRSGAHGEQAQEVQRDWTRVGWTCPRCEGKGKRSRSERGGEARDGRENAGVEYTTAAYGMNDRGRLKSEVERARERAEGMMKRAEKVIQEGERARREAEEVRKWCDKRLATSDFGGEYRRTNDKWWNRLWSSKWKKTLKAPTSRGRLGWQSAYCRKGQ